ncbi:hypothetical protein AOA12_06055 [Microbacterium sp. No. 7]|nr:hypothetical protein AOA12_06055 [Microbacterium sp. No. 7]
MVAIVRVVDGKVADLLEESDAAPEIILRERDISMHGWGSETRAEVVAVTVRWQWQSRTRGLRDAAVTVIETVIGGRGAGGDGWGEIAQYASTGLLTADEARTFATLALSGLLPKRAGWSEL